MAGEVTFDISALQAAADRLRAALPASALAGAQAIANEGVRQLEVVSPRNTQRYVRAWLDAGNRAGLGPFVLPPIRPDRYAKLYRRYLLYQVSQFERIVRDNMRQGRTDRAASTARRRLAAAKRELSRYRPDSIVIGLQIFAGRRGGERYVRFGTRPVVTVRHKVYGGEGRSAMVGSDAVVSLKNLEPHARLVERRFSIVKRLERAARSVGAPRASRETLGRLAAAGRGAGVVVMA